MLYLRGLYVAALLTLSVCTAGCSVGASGVQKTTQNATIGRVAPQGYKLRRETLLKSGGTWFTPAYYRGCELIGKVQYGSTAVKHGLVYIAAGNGGSVPSGYMPYMYVYIDVIEPQTAEFQGSGLMMSMRSKYFKNFAGADFFLFLYDTYNNLLAQSELGPPSGDAFTFPSLYQNGFVVMPQQGQGGYYFQLGYTYNGLGPLTHQPPGCGE